MLTSENHSFEGGWFDSHCHLNHLEPLSPLLSSAEKSGIQRFLIPSTTREEWPRIQQLSGDRVLYALGTHPWFVADAQAEASALDIAIRQRRPDAIGEIGLDFYPAKTPRPSRNLQIESFERQLQIVQQHRLPVIVHCVKAHQEVIVLLKRYHITNGVIHAFNGSYPLAKQYVDLGFKLGIGPALMNSKKLPVTVAQLGLEHLLLETDAPYMNQESKGANPLLTLISVGEYLAALQKKPVAEVCEQTTLNARRLFAKTD